MAHTVRGWVTYTDDEGNNVSLRVSAATAAANGVTLFATPPVGSSWGYNHKDLRHVCGVAAGGFRSRMTIVDTVRPLYNIGATWNDSLGNTYTVTSLIGEAKRAQDAR